MRKGFLLSAAHAAVPLPPPQCSPLASRPLLRTASAPHNGGCDLPNPARPSQAIPAPQHLRGGVCCAAQLRRFTTTAPGDALQRHAEEEVLQSLAHDVDGVDLMGISFGPSSESVEDGQTAQQHLYPHPHDTPTTPTEGDEIASTPPPPQQQRGGGGGGFSEIPETATPSSRKGGGGRAWGGAAILRGLGGSVVGVEVPPVVTLGGEEGGDAPASLSSWEGPEGGVAGPTPRRTSGVFADVFEYLRVRGVPFRDIVQWEVSKRQKLLEQVFPDCPLSVHRALKEWEERNTQGRTSGNPRCNPSASKAQGQQAMHGLRQVIAAGHIGRTQAGLRYIICDLKLPLRIIASPISEICKSKTIPQERKVSLIAEARRLLASEGIRPDTKLFTSFMRLCRSYEEAREIFSEMTRAGCTPDGVTYATAMKSCETSLPAVRNIMRNMEAQRIRPTEVHYGILLRSAALSGERAEIWRIWGAMESAGLRDSPHSHAIMVSAVLSQLPWVTIHDSSRDGSGSSSNSSGVKSDTPDPPGAGSSSSTTTTTTPQRLHLRPQRNSDLSEVQRHCLRDAEALVRAAEKAGASSDRIYTHLCRAQPEEGSRVATVLSFMEANGLTRLRDVPRVLQNSAAPPGSASLREAVERRFPKEAAEVRGGAVGKTWRINAPPRAPLPGPRDVALGVSRPADVSQGRLPEGDAGERYRSSRSDGVVSEWKQDAQPVDHIAELRRGEGRSLWEVLEEAESEYFR